ncbi:hypothetical protein SNE40_017831 [Patella caerulea]|uniref:Peptidase S1 domain-containing protein n=1 Tax=Patella caerulea TaxID=87958 RepID=A0AAN8PET4_PATCE
MIFSVIAGALIISFANAQLCPLLLKSKHAECRDSCDGFGTLDTTFQIMGCLGQQCCIPDPAIESETTTPMTTTTQPPSGPTMNSAEECGMASTNPTTRILQGSMTKPCDWPWQISVRSRIVGTDEINPGNTFPWCSGVLIDNQWVLTTAYCVILSVGTVTGVIENNILAVAGEHNTKQPDFSGTEYNEKFIKVVDAIVHPGYYKNDPATYTGADLADSADDKTSNNFALLKLQTPLEFGDCIRKVCTPLMEDCWTKKECKIAGWGNKNAANIGEISEELVAADIMVYSPAVCEAVYGIQFNETGPMKQLTTCAKAVNPETNVCLGDNGGMVVCKNDQGKWTLEGLINRPNHEQCDPGSLFLVSYVQPAMEWIKSVTGI